MSTDDPDLAAEFQASRRKVLELEAELEAANRLLNSFKAMLFGSRSEKASIVLDAQERLDLGDLGQASSREVANDDQPLRARPRQARRNIGGLPGQAPKPPPSSNMRRIPTSRPSSSPYASITSELTTTTHLSTDPVDRRPPSSQSRAVPSQR